jgi:hypothetical protein
MGVLVVTVVTVDLLSVLCLLFRAPVARRPIWWGTEQALLTHRHQPPEHLLLLT